MQPADDAEAAPALASYFAPLLAGRGEVGAAPQLGDLIGAAGGGDGGDSELRHVLLSAAEQQLQLRHQQLQYLVHTCPVTLLPAPGTEEGQQAQPEEEEEEVQRQARQARQQRQEQRLAAQRLQAETDLGKLADFLVSAADDEAARPAFVPATLQLAARTLPVLQSWAAPPLLQALLQACLRQAATAGAAGTHTEHQRLCRQLLLGGDLLEQPRLAALLPAAAAAELAAALRCTTTTPAAGPEAHAPGSEACVPRFALLCTSALQKQQRWPCRPAFCNSLRFLAPAPACSAVPEPGWAAAADREQDGSAKKRRKKEGHGDAAPAAASSGGWAAASEHGAALLQQLGRLAKGKAVKSSAWAAAVQGACADIAAVAEGGGSNSSKKRKQQPGGSDGAPGAADSLHAVHSQAELFAQLPLAYLQPEAAASMAALCLGTLLCCCHAGVSQQQQAAGSALLRATAGCLAVLARLAGDGVDGPCGLASQLQLLPHALKAALESMGRAAGGCDDSSDDDGAQLLASAAEHGVAAMQAVCAARLAAAGSADMCQLADGLSTQLAQGPLEARWAASVLAQACLAACYEAAGPADSRAGSTAVAEIVCGDSARQARSSASAAAAGAAAARLEAAVAAALPAAAAAAPDGWQQAMLAGALYRCSAQLLRLRCCEGPVADELAARQRQGADGAGCISGMAGALQAAAGLLDHHLLPLEQQDGAQGAALNSSGAGVLVRAVLEYVAACGAATGRMRPAASSTHYASLLALLLHTLARLPADVGGCISPSRRLLPFAAAFPAAAAEAAAAQSAARQGSGGASGARPLLLEALRDLVAGSSSQQLLLPLRFVEAALPATPASSSAALALSELLVVLLEAASGSRQQRLLGQHSERVAALLTTFVSTAACTGRVRCQQPKRVQHAMDSPKQLAASILAAAGAEMGIASDAQVAAAGGGAAAAAAAARGLTAPCTIPVHERPAAAAPGQVEVAALCTALRALESLAARPKLFALPPAAACSMLSSVTAVWTAFAEAPQQTARLGSWAVAAPLPGFCFRLDASTGAGLFAGSCQLLMALLRHRQQARRGCGVGGRGRAHEARACAAGVVAAWPQVWWASCCLNLSATYLAPDL